MLFFKLKMASGSDRTASIAASTWLSSAGDIVGLLLWFSEHVWRSRFSLSNRLLLNLQRQLVLESL